MPNSLPNVHILVTAEEREALYVRAAQSGFKGFSAWARYQLGLPALVDGRKSGKKRRRKRCAHPTLPGMLPKAPESSSNVTGDPSKVA